jgi:autotransporter-associated beta strand protein
MEAKNWVGDVAPVAGADLVFPTGAANLTSFNSFPDGTQFNSITFSGSSYTISGAAIDLGAGGMASSATSGTNRFTGAIQLDDVRAIDVASGGSLELTGVLSGSGGFKKTSTGTLTLNGPGDNTYTGLTEVDGGILQLNKGDATGPGVAIPSDLDFPSFGKIEVQLLRDNQIADDVKVKLTRTSLNLNGFSDTIGGLDMTGGTVETRRFDSFGGIAASGMLTLNGDVTAQAFQLDAGNFEAAIIKGRISLGSTRTFTVNDLPGSDIDLFVTALISVNILRKEGAGQLRLLDAPDQVEVNDGTLFYDGHDLPFGATLRNDGLLSGDGRITGPVSSLGGSSTTLDNGDSGFTATAGWNSLSGKGFGSDFRQAAPSGLVGQQIASWVFTGLRPGLYRVFATWPAGASNATKVLYSIFDGQALRTTAPANQELTPTGGPRDGGVAFQQLAGVVKIVSGTLKVQVTNQVSSETDGSNVIADAIRIERLAGALTPGDAVSDVSTLRAGGITLGPGSTYHVDLTTGTADRLDVTGSFVSSGALLALSSTSFTPPAKGTAYRIINNGTGSPGTFSNLPNNGDIVELLVGGQRHFFSINYAAGDGNDVDLIYQNTGTQVSDLKLSPDVVEEGHQVTLHGALTDPNPGDVLSLRVNWGDGTAVQTFTDLGTRPFEFHHVYAHKSPDGSPYEVRVEWFDQHGDGNFRKLFVTVNGARSRKSFSGAELIPLSKERADFGTGLDVQSLAVRPAKKSHSELRVPQRGRR